MLGTLDVKRVHVHHTVMSFNLQLLMQLLLHLNVDVSWHYAVLMPELPRTPADFTHVCVLRWLC